MYRPINRRTNLNDLAKKNRDQVDDEDDLDSFTQSKVDGDNETFYDPNEALLDSLLKKKKDQQKTGMVSPNLTEIIKTNPSNPSTPPVSEKQISTGLSEARQSDSKRNAPPQQKIPIKVTPPIEPISNQPLKRPEPQVTPARDTTIKEAPKTEPKKIEKKVEQPKTPQKELVQQKAQNEAPYPKTPQKEVPQQKTPQKEIPKQNIEQPKQQTPAREYKEEAKAQPKSETKSEPRSAQKNTPSKVEQPKQEPVKQVTTPVKDPKPVKQAEPAQISRRGSQLDTIPEEDQKTDPPVIHSNRASFVRRGKNVPHVKELMKQVKDAIIEDRIIALEPRNYIEVNKSLALRRVPGEPFVDQLFPPNYKSVFQVQKENLEFKRVTNDRPLDLIQVIDPNDIQPGFYSRNIMNALTACAEKPEIFKRIFEDQQVNEYGFYYVRLCIDGVWKYILMDDHMPFLNDQPIATGTSNDLRRMNSLKKTNPGYESELWPFLIEKGLAKVYGSYQDMSIESTLRTTLSEITGAPIVEEVIDDKTILDDCIGIIRGYQDYDNGLTFLRSDKQTVTVRNPWGWATNVPKGVSEEGEFTINRKDLNGSRLIKALWNKDYYSISHGIRQVPDSYSLFELRIDQDTHFHVTLHQKDIRFFRNNLKKKYNYCKTTMIIFDSESLIASRTSSYKTGSIEVNLTPGTYYLAVFMGWQVEYDCSLSFYLSEPIEIVRFNYKENPNKLADLLVNLAIDNGTKKGQEYEWKIDNQILVCAWKGDKSIQKDLTKIKDRLKWLPLTYVDANLNTLPLQSTSQDAHKQKVESWQQLASVNIQLSPEQSTFAVVLKAIEE